VPLELNVSTLFAGGELAAPLCRACTDLQFLDGSGAILELRHELEGARFPLGRVTITGGAVAVLAAAGQHVAAFLARHVRGDWGENGDFDHIHLTHDERRAHQRLPPPGIEVNGNPLEALFSLVNDAIIVVVQPHLTGPDPLLLPTTLPLPLPLPASGMTLCMEAFS
jgi:hypothetical protein